MKDLQERQRFGEGEGEKWGLFIQSDGITCVEYIGAEEEAVYTMAVGITE